ncbi:MAG: glycosyltransferase family 39 protein [Candidatus Roizmanbacteria bacterium]|nr:glycosyltransferase family 39 protein [Candidatus Roizmanbacteria bacterium]
MRVKILLILTVFSLGIYFLNPIHPDEGVFGTIAQSMLHGKVIYRDLFDHKPPGIHVLLAGTFYLFGDSILSLRAIVIFANIISAFLVYFFLREVGERLAILGSILFLLVVPLVHGTYALTEVFTVPFLLLSVYYIVRHIEKRWHILGSGFFLGVCLLFKITFLLTALACILYLIVSASTFKNGVKRAVYFSIGLIVPLAVLVLMALYYQLHSELIEQVIRFVLVNYPPEINHRYISLLVFLSFSLLGFFIVVFYGMREKSMYFKQKKVILLIIMSIIPSLIYRPYHHYWIPIIPFLIIFSILGVNGKKWREKVLLVNGIAISVVFLFYTAYIGYPKLQHQIHTAKEIENCAQVHDPITYFLAKCTPEKKYFFEVF